MHDEAHRTAEPIERRNCRLAMQSVASLAELTYLLMRCLQIDRVKLMALASEEELALMKKTQQLAEEVHLSALYLSLSEDDRAPAAGFAAPVNGRAERHGM